MSFYSPIDKLAAESTRPKGTGAEFMTELSKRPGYKQAEVEDRDLQALQALPKMARDEFMAALKAKPATVPKATVLGENHHEEYTLPGGTNYREILLQHPQGGYPGKREHFGGAPNVLASLRVKDRTSPEGKKVLHIEEIQSDWHKQGQKHGYLSKGENPQEEIRKAKQEHDVIGQKLRRARTESTIASDSLASDKPLYQNPDVRARLSKTLAERNNEIMELTPAVMRAEEAHRRAVAKANYSVPDAPFKKDWHELALKRMIHHAAKNGYDEIHITPGDTQAKRWGAGGDDEGKGFRDLYDKKMPQFLNKFGKQHGAQVGSAAIDETPVHSFPITDAMREHVLKNGMPLYAEGGDVSRETTKPVPHGIIKERVTVTPDKDVMQYELMSVNRLTKKAKQ